MTGNEPTTRPTPVFTLVRNARRHHHALTNFIARDLRIKYRGTALGYLWSLLEPMSLVLVYWFVFSVIARRGGPDYPLVVLLGVLPYALFASVLQGGTQALTSNRALIKRIYLPREIFVLGHAGTQTVVFLLSMLSTIPFLVVYDARPGWWLTILPAVVLGISGFATGLALALSCVNVFYRDVGYVLQVVLRLGFYATPVIYPLDLVPERFLSFYLLNPMAAYITMIRTALTGGPDLVPLPYIGFAFLASLLTLLCGAAVFVRMEASAVKYL